MKRQLRARKVVASKNKGNAAARFVEAMEPRLLLATWWGGYGTPALNGQPAVNYVTETYPFVDAAGNPAGPAQPVVHEWSFVDASGKNIYVYMGGNVQAEFIFATVTGQTATLSGQYVPTPAGSGVKGSDLYAIYVAHADLNSFIAIENVDTSNNGQPTPHPFDSTGGQLRIWDANAGKEATQNIGPGVAFMGARSVNLNGQQNADNYPILSAAFPTGGIGLMPANPLWSTTLSPGLIVADGQDLGKFIFGGTITGQVTIGGSMEQFYAGMLLTGDAAYGAGGGGGGIVIGGGGPGGPGGIGSIMLPGCASYFPGNVPASWDGYSPLPTPVNFYVKHDLRNLLVQGSIGTIGNPGNGMPGYQTDFRALVGGRLGQLKTDDSLVGNVTVQGIGSDGKPAGPSYLPALQHELEAREYNFIPFAYTDPMVAQTTPGARQNFAAWDEQTVAFENGDLDTSAFYNDTFATAQYLGSFTTTGANPQDIIQVQGTLMAETFTPDPRGVSKDFSDYYGVGLMAGQTVDVQLQDAAAAAFARQFPGVANPYTYSYIQVGVFDPDGRLITSDYVDAHAAIGQNPKIRFTADRPGVYRFAVSLSGDNDFQTHLATTGETIEPYELTITNVKAITLGGIVVGNTFYDSDSMSNGVDVQAGDLGGIYVGGTFMSMDKVRTVTDYTAVGAKALTPAQLAAKVPYSVLVENGNIRSIDGNNIGVQSKNSAYAFSWWIDISAPKGSVGLVQARATSANKGELALNYDGYMWSDPRLAGYVSYTQYQMKVVLDPITNQPVIDPTTQQPLVQPDLLNPTQGWIKMSPVAGDYQVVSAAGQLYGNIVCEGNVGIIRAGSMDTITPSTIQVNASRKYLGGTIDLIDVAGNMGYWTTGGPQITTGPQGNVRYMVVGGTIYRDSLFGSRTTATTAYPRGQAVTINDDSGAAVTLKPASTAGVTITLYPIRGSGGSAIVRVVCPANLTVTSAVAKSKGSAEIGQIDMSGAGNATLAISGTARMDVLSIIGGNFVSISNATPGELVKINAASIGKLSAETVGFSAISSTTSSSANGFTGGFSTFDNNINRLAINPQAVILNNFPFNQQHQGVVVSGTLTQVLARRALGNISAGNIGTVTPNSDNRANTTYGFEGIIGPIYASGSITQVNIGMGIPTSGAGNMAWSGIFAGNTIGKVVGSKADICGIIAAGRAINSITLTSGSIIGANIWVGNLLDSRYLADIKTVASDGDPLSKPIFEIGSVTVTGSATAGSRNGGIIGTLFGASDIGTIRVSNGFGIFNSDFWLGTDGVLDRVEADGYGLRKVYMDAGAKVNNIIAHGDGRLIPVNTFEASVTSSPATPASPWNNLYTFFNSEYAQSKYAVPGGVIVGAKSLTVNGITNAGVISGVIAEGTHDMTLLQGWRLEGGPSANPTDSSAYILPEITMGMVPPPYVGIITTPVPPASYQTSLPVQPPPSPLPPVKSSMFNFGNSIKTIKVDSNLDGVDIVTGALSTMTVGTTAGTGNVTNLSMTVAGLIGTLFINGNLGTATKDTLGNVVLDPLTDIEAIGWNGQIGSLTVNGHIYGTINAAYRIARKVTPLYNTKKDAGVITANGVLL